MIYRAPKLRDDERRVMDLVEDLRSNLRYATRTPPRWYGLLRRNIHARNIRASNAIEQHNVTLDDAIAAVESEQPFEASEEDWKAVAGYQAAMTYVLQLAKRPRLVYSSETLFALHYMMVGYDLSRHPGNLRPGPIGVYDSSKGMKVYDAPDPEELPRLIGELIQWLNNPDDSPPLVTAAMAHLNLVLIHPFVDGNGRMSRCLQSLVLAGYITDLDPAFLSIEAYLGRNTDDYYSALDAVAQGSWKPETDTRPWIRFCLSAHYQQAISLRRRWRTYQRLWDALEIEINKHQLPDRVILALSDAAFGLKVRNATYRKAADISGQVASRDLTVLAQHSLLEMKGRARGAHYVRTDKLSRIMDACTEPPVIEDPFSLPPSAKQPGQL